MDDAALREAWARTLPTGDWDALSPSATFKPPGPPAHGATPGAATAPLATPGSETELVVPAPAETRGAPPSRGPSATGALEGELPTRYVLERELGRGGMGVVFRARQSGLAREVAVKRLIDDGKKLASADIAGVAIVWDAVGVRPLVALPPHAGWATSVAFSPDGRRLATGSVDRTVRLWDLAELEGALTKSPEVVAAEVERETGLTVNGVDVVARSANRLTRD